MSSEQEIQQRLNKFRDDFQTLREEIGKVIVGQDEVVEGTLTAMVAGGHVLLEGVPGLGKTLLVRTLADALHIKFSRVQFTPDLMPADLVGTNVVTETPEGGRRFEFQPGPIFCNVLLADEINRATPKTQSALLEAMQERSVTVGGVTHELARPYFVLATQNPIEMEGTYPLPEAQLDRFLFKILVPFPGPRDIETILERTTEAKEPSVTAIFEGAQCLEMGQLAREIPIAQEVRRYGVQVVMATHPDQASATEKVKRYVRFGSSPRGAQAVILAAKIRAILDGRYNVSREDIQRVAKPALRHRIILNFEGQAENISPDEIIDDIVASTPVAPEAQAG